MPRISFESIDIIVSRPGRIDKIWENVSKKIVEKYGLDSDISKFSYEAIFNDLFAELEFLFENLMNKISPISFFLYVNILHEDSIRIWEAQLKGLDLKEDTINFSVYRRSLKVILERSVTLNLVISPSFYNESKENENKYILLVEELLAILSNAFMVVDFHSRFRFFPDSIELNLINNKIEIEPSYLYKEIYDYIINDIPKHDDKVIGHNLIEELYDSFMRDEINFQLFSEASGSYIGSEEHMFKLIKYDEFVALILKQLGIEKNRIIALFDGLSVSSCNVLSFKKILYSSQDPNRLIYRPLLRYEIGGVRYFLSGNKRWSESIVALTTNCLPFGYFQEEWKIFANAYSFINKVKNHHESLILSVARNLFESKNVIFEIDVKSVFRKNKSHFSLKRKGLGQIDAIFIDIEKFKIYVCEFKHNRSRADFPGWNHDYEKFKEEYELKLSNKFNWVKENKSDIIYHFARKYPVLRDIKAEFKVEAIFIINAPTIYMYNSMYMTLTLKLFEDLLDQNLILHKFNLEAEFSSNLEIEIPYFENIRIVKSLVSSGIII